MTDPRPLLLVLCLAFTGCAGHKKTAPPPTAGAETRPGTAAKTAGQGALSPTKNMILALAKREWEYFGKQTILFDGEEESIPHVGKWEDDGELYAVRVNWYWRSVGKPQLDGNDCHQPWSAAFVSWIMQESGVPEYLFPAADAHRDYLLSILNQSGAEAGFIGHSAADYSPQPGDLLCATRGRPGESLDGLDPRLILQDHTKLHCDIVVERRGDVLALIGGNVRNSVSKTVLKLEPNGMVKPNQRRPWFMVLENRL